MYCVNDLFRDSADWLESSGQILLAWSIFNPNGPTISCLGLRDTDTRNELEVFYRWFHFLGGEDYCLGYVNSKDEDFEKELAMIIHRVFTLSVDDGLKSFPLLTCIPSVMATHADENWLPIIKSAVMSSQAIREADWGRDLYLIEKYGGDLFPRAGEEVREGYEQLKADHTALGEHGNEYLQMTWLKHQHIPSFTNWIPGQYESRPFDKEDFETWWATVTDETFWPSAFFQLAQAWVGAIGQVAGGELEVKTPLEEVKDFFSHYSFPIWPESISTESIL